MADEEQKKLTQEEYLAQKYGDFQGGNSSSIEATVYDRHGNPVVIGIREFTEEKLQLREEVMIDQSGVMRNARQQGKKNRRARGTPQIKVRPSNRRRFDMIEGVEYWDMMRPKRTKDNAIVFEKENDGQTLKLDEEGYPIPVMEPVPCEPKEKLNLKGYLSEQMVKEVRKINDLPLGDEEEEDEDEGNEEPESTSPYDTDFDMSLYGDDGESEGSDDNVAPLQNQSESTKPNEKSEGTSKTRRNSGSSS